jgi:hypothetical protein
VLLCTTTTFISTDHPLSPSTHTDLRPVCTFTFHSADIGLIGLAVMGQNLILNMNGE